MFRMRGNTAELLRYRVQWEHVGASGEETREEFCATEQEKDALVARLRSETTRVVTPFAGKLPNPDERFVLAYNQHRAPVEIAGAVQEDWVEDEECVAAWNAGTAPSGDRVLKYNQWMKTNFSVSNANFGNFELFFKYGNGSDAYIRAVKVYATAHPEQYIRWGRFSDEEEIVENTFHLRPGFTYVDFVEKDGVMTCHLPGNWSKAHIEVKRESMIIPEYTSELTVEVEYWVDDPIGFASAPMMDEKPANRNVLVETLDCEQDEWFDQLEFDSVEQASATLAAGKDAYTPPVSDAQRLEQDITMLQLALVELYEEGKI